MFQKKETACPGLLFLFSCPAMFSGRLTLLKTFQYGLSAFINGKSAKNSDTDLKLFYNMRTKKSSGFS